MPSDPPQEDPFAPLHNFEETFYTTGYNAGIADGSRAGRIEGRVFGLEKGFEKFLELGRLAGRAEVWNARLTTSEDASAEKDGGAFEMPEEWRLEGNPRLEKHVASLRELVEPATFDTRNTEEGVADFDDRVKRGGSKAKVIERIIGETDIALDEDEVDANGQQGRNTGVRITRQQAQEKNMEDFGRMPQIRRGGS